jgi:hypothetical protein
MSLTEKLLSLEGDPRQDLFKSNSVNELDISPQVDKIHRSVAALFVAGNSPAQIAVKLDLPGEKVRVLLKRQNTQQVIKELLQDQGDEGVENILRATEVDNILKMIEIRDSPNTLPNVALTACKMISEIQRGKVPYRKGDEDSSVTGDKLAGKVSDLDKQIQNLSKKNF